MTETPPEGTPLEGTPPEGTPPEGMPPEGTPSEGTPPEGTPPEGAPEAYTDFTMPEGWTPDEAIMTPFKEVAKGMNLTQDQAQSLVTMFNEWRQSSEQASADDWQKTQDGWLDSSKADKEFGGDKFEENVALGVQAIERFGTPELKELLDMTGLGDHPEVLRFAIKVGRAISDDTLHRQSGEPPLKPGQKDASALLFPSVAQEQ